MYEHKHFPSWKTGKRFPIKFTVNCIRSFTHHKKKNSNKNSRALSYDIEKSIQRWGLVTSEYDINCQQNITCYRDTGLPLESFRKYSSSHEEKKQNSFWSCYNADFWNFYSFILSSPNSLRVWIIRLHIMNLKLIESNVIFLYGQLF